MKMDRENTKKTRQKDKTVGLQQQTGGEWGRSKRKTHINKKSTGKP
jgi:hypothetical protein